MANRMYLTTDNIKSLVAQYNKDEKKVYIADYKPKDGKDTLVLVSELKKEYKPYGFLLYWANKDTLDKAADTEKIAKELEESGLPF